MADGTMGVVLGPDLDVAIQLRWAVRLAEARSLDLLILQHVESKESTTVEPPLHDPTTEKASPVARQVMELIAASPQLRAPAIEDSGEDEATVEETDTLEVRLKEIRCDGTRVLRDQVLAQIRKNKLKLCTTARRDLITSDVDVNMERQLFLRYAPCEIVLCYGLQPTTDLSRVVIGAARRAPRRRRPPSRP